MMDSSDLTIETIYKVLRQYYAVPTTKLSSDLSINGDLGIDGDDAVELIEFLEKEIGRTIEIDFSKYFYGEGLIQFGTKENLPVEGLRTIILAN